MLSYVWIALVQSLTIRFEGEGEGDEGHPHSTLTITLTFGDDGNLVDSVDGTIDGNHGTYSSTEVNGPASDDQGYVVEDNYATSSDELSDTEDYTYHNPKDSRRWTEE